MMPSRPSSCPLRLPIWLAFLAAVAAPCFATAQAPAAIPTKAQALAGLGQHKAFSFFTLSTRIPKGWSSAMPSYTYDPSTLKRLCVVETQALLGRSLGKLQYFTLPILVEVGLGAVADRRTRLTQWLMARFRREYLDSYEQSLGLTVTANQSSELTPAPGRTVTMAMLGAQGQASAYTQRRVVYLAGALVQQGSLHALIGVVLASSNSFYRLDNNARQALLRRFQAVSKQVFFSAMLTTLKQPARDRGAERMLAARGRFVHGLTSRSIMGTLSRTSFAHYQLMDFRFFRDGTCTYRDDFSTSYSHTSRGQADNPYDDPRSRTSGMGGDRSRGQRVRYEVRRVGSRRFLVLYPSGGTVLYTLDRSGVRRCGRKTIRGLALDGKVEGLYRIYMGICAHTAAKGR